jgi:DNA (cytosine-5)-methyltransferase 1
MNNKIVLLDLFSGIGGFSLGLEQAGFKITRHYYSEIDKHAIAIYKYQFKNSTYAGSVTDLDGRTITRPNIITFGSPCQDFSVAGKRAGLEGQRSSLIGQAIRLITECKPNLFIWENVKGVFSSNSGEDFWAVIQALANIGGYRLEWQLLNTAWFLPQNRERIYLIGHLAESKRGFGQVFPFIECSGANDGNTNTLTGVQKDNLIVCDWRDDEGLRIRDDGNSPTINARAREDKYGVPMVISHYGHKNKDPQESEISPTLKANSHGHEPMTVHNMLPQSGNPRDGGTGHLTKNDGTTYCLDTGNTNGIEQNRRIRRLTPIECERLQGFPDGWTEYGNYDGVVKKVANTQRYKTLGNAITVRVMEEIGKKLLNLLK